MAMAAFVLADYETPNPGLNGRLFEARASLPIYGKGFLLRALLRSKAPSEQIETLQNEIIQSAVVNGDSAVIVETVKGLSEYFSTNTRTSAIALSAFLEANPDLPVVPKLVEGIKSARLSNGRWTNTQENIYAIVALADYARTMRSSSATVSISLGETELRGKTVRGGEVYRVSRSLAELKPGDLTIRTSGKVFCSARLVLTKDVGQDDAVDQGFTITREYLDFETEQPVEKATVGQLIKTRITISTPEERNYVALVDRLPAGCEAVNSRLATEGYPETNDERSSYIWDHRELRDDQAEAFCDRMPKGTFHFEYVMRATIAGSFLAAPAHGEAMYNPEKYGQTPAHPFPIMP